MSRLGDAIRKARLAKKMTEKQLGRKCGMAENVIKDIESGRRIIADDQAQRILKLLGADGGPLSTELDVAAEPEVQLRPRPRAYILPAKDVAPEQQQAVNESTDAWLDALGGVVKRVPVMDPKGVVIDHVLTPIIGGKIEGGAPDKVLYYRMPDDSLRGFRVHAGDLLLTIPESRAQDGALMLIEYKGVRMVRKLLKMDGMRIQMQSFDREFESVIAPQPEVKVLGRCVKLQRTL
ncbi:MAG: helix-turn-helix domain-containing protein [Clostridia bacterium]|nr:helix-turn-helix domain-containing protein [Clostridia bacterium]